LEQSMHRRGFAAMFFNLMVITTLVPPSDAQAQTS
jgi:hypothetical protein